MVEATIEYWKALVAQLESALRWEKAQVLMLQTELAKMKFPPLEKAPVKEIELG
jgi:hypothetical protein